MLKELLPTDSGGFPNAIKGGRAGLALLAAHIDAAYNLARYLMRNETDAEDIVQSSYVRAISHFDGFRGGDGRGWLLKIVRNTCYDSMRKMGAPTRHTNFDEALHSEGSPDVDPETALLRMERTELVRKALGELPAMSREVLVLRELEQLSYREIADIAGIPVGTVMSRLSRARQQLQRTLSPHLDRSPTVPSHFAGARVAGADRIFGS